MARVRAQCRVTRMVADEWYAAGETYVMDADRAEKYAARGDFLILGPAELEPDDAPAPDPAPETRMRPRPENKQRVRPGWKGASGSGRPSMLDGTVVEEAPE